MKSKQQLDRLYKKTSLALIVIEAEYEKAVDRVDAALEDKKIITSIDGIIDFNTLVGQMHKCSERAKEAKERIKVLRWVLDIDAEIPNS